MTAGRQVISAFFASARTIPRGLLALFRRIAPLPSGALPFLGHIGSLPPRTPLQSPAGRCLPGEAALREWPRPAKAHG
jgi:hypothetical protein